MAERKECRIASSRPVLSNMQCTAGRFIRNTHYARTHRETSLTGYRNAKSKSSPYPRRTHNIWCLTVFILFFFRSTIYHTPTSARCIAPHHIAHILVFCIFHCMYLRIVNLRFFKLCNTILCLADMYVVRLCLSLAIYSVFTFCRFLEKFNVIPHCGQCKKNWRVCACLCMCVYVCVDECWMDGTPHWNWIRWT